MTKGWLSLLIAMALLSGACGKKSQEEIIEKAVEKNSGGKAHVDLSKQKMTIETKEGGKVEIASGGEGLKVPADFPKDIYIYRGAKVEGSIKTGDAIQLTLQTVDADAKVADEYKRQMKQTGWTEKTTAQMGGMTMLQYAKDQRSLMVHLSRDGKITRIMLMMSTESRKQLDR